MDQTFKYASQVSHLTNCPPTSATSLQRQAFRFVHSDSSMSNKSFLPRALLLPGRKLKGEQRCCESYALSMFDTEEKARAKFLKLSESNQLIKQHLGDQLAKGSVDPADGLSTKSNSEGHFSFFEFSGVDLSGKFNSIGAL